MIARSWHGAVPFEHGEAFAKYLNLSGVAEATTTPGNLGVNVYRSVQDGYEHFFMVSYWIDFEAIEAFDGSKLDLAVTYPDDTQYGLISDPLVLHHKVERMANIPFVQD